MSLISLITPQVFTIRLLELPSSEARIKVRAVSVRPGVKVPKAYPSTSPLISLSSLVQVSSMICATYWLLQLRVEYLANQSTGCKWCGGSCCAMLVHVLRTEAHVPENG